jgi:peptidoglycan/xylan/chitin deacetylase (PgdA/CDA1 family)
MQFNRTLNLLFAMLLIAFFIGCSDDQPTSPVQQGVSKQEVSTGQDLSLKKTTSGSVYLCFDDGPTGSSSSLVNAIKNAGATATFFIWGNRISGNSGGFSAIKNAGFSIQNHSYTHQHMTSWSVSQVQNDLSQCNSAITAKGCSKPYKVRLPYLESTANIRSACSALGLSIVSPTVDSKDWNGASTSAIVSAVSNLSSGGNCLCHDGYSTTISAIPQIVTNLKNKGFSFARY